ncbi:MAG: hypothetical protein MZW92_36255 [Comamonadaceae bacterium]|nr:hypothetical protein [Comamonadaceae bacterium]
MQVKAVLLLRPTQSLALHLQQEGRACARLAGRRARSHPRFRGEHHGLNGDMNLRVSGRRAALVA